MGSKSIQYGTTVALPVPVPESGLFSHGVTSDLLALLVDNPYAAFGIRDLGRAVDSPHRSVSAAVDDLAAVDLVEISHDGRKKLVQIDRSRLTKPDDPILQIPQSAFQEPVQEAMSRLVDRLPEVEGIVLFGSVARGAADRRSDVDCFVLVGGNQATAQQTAHEIAADLGEERFDGDRYRFQLLVESTDSARQYGDRLREIFATGLTLLDSETLRDLKAEVLAGGR